MSDTAEVSRLRRHAELGGVDVLHYWGNRSYSFWTQLAVSQVGGDTAAMRRTQLGSSHYFQRPFRTETSDGLFDIRYDPTRTSLRGYGLYARLAKESGDWLWETQQNWRSPGFEVNDLGTLSRTGYKWMMADVLRQWTKPTSWYRDAAAIVGGQTAFNYEGDRTDLQSEIWGRVTLPNYIGVSGFVINHPPVLDPLRTRGGVVQKTSGYNFLAINFWGDQRNAISWDGGSSQGRNITDAGWQADGYADLVIKPLVNVRLSFGPYYSRNVEPNQFVTRVTDQTATAFGGQRNVFARLDQHSFSMQTRLNATFTPNLTLELFAQPFLASGAYSQLKQYAAPGVSDVLVYGTDVGTVVGNRGADGITPSYTGDPDGQGPAQAFTVGNPAFNVRSLRGTGVPTGGGRVCTTEARAGITVDVRDSASNVSAGRGSVIIVREGAFADTSRDTGVFDGPYGLVYERAGTYDLTVLQKGFALWSRSGVAVTNGECHVNGIAVTLRLQH